MSVYACSDLHGSINLYNQIANFLKPEDTVYFLGDASDRGPNSWETVKAVYSNKQFIYLKGNHEDMLVRAAREYFTNDETPGYKYHLLCYNGGMETFDDWSAEEFRNEWIARLDKLPLRAEYVNENGVRFLMSHAGFTPSKSSVLEEDLLWSREHFFDKWPEEEEKTVILHGHTPIPNLYKRLNELYKFYHNEDLEYIDEPGIYTYCGGHKICLDCGTFATGRIVLFDLDTYDEHIFEES